MSLQCLVAVSLVAGLNFADCWTVTCIWLELIEHTPSKNECFHSQYTSESGDEIWHLVSKELQGLGIHCKSEIQKEDQGAQLLDVTEST